MGYNKLVLPSVEINYNSNGPRPGRWVMNYTIEDRKSLCVVMAVNIQFSLYIFSLISNGYLLGDIITWQTPIFLSICKRTKPRTKSIYSHYFVHFSSPLQWRHNGSDGFSNHQPRHCLLKRLFGRRWKQISKLRVTGLCVGKSPGTGEFTAQMTSNAENVSIWWSHHATDPNLTRVVLGMAIFLFDINVCQFSFKMSNLSYHSEQPLLGCDICLNVSAIQIHAYNNSR